MVIYIIWCNHEIQKFPIFVAYRMQFGPDVSHGVFFPLCCSLECLMKKIAANEADACIFAQKHSFDGQSQGVATFLYFYKTVWETAFEIDGVCVCRPFPNRKVLGIW